VRAETDAAISAARLARCIADSRAGADAVRSKGGIDIVTAADIACEDAIRAELARAFPAYPVVGEERGGQPRGDSPYWLVDPICGTRCYASDVPLYCTNIALVERGEVTVAAIAVGRSGEVLYAERGGGAWLVTDGCATRIDHPNRRAGDMRTATGGDLPAESPPTTHRAATSDASNVVWIHGRGPLFVDFARAIWGDDRWFVWTFTSTVSYAYLAAGRIAGIVHLGARIGGAGPPVHTAAGCLVVQEAGATITDAETGHPWTLASRTFIAASTPRLHTQLAALVEKSR
jgi:fructose-1,6-bisphosphatase/inositol monophosphatase family enzyme